MLFTKVRQLVRSGRYVVGQHAIERLEERGVLEWQVVDGVASAELITERPTAKPNPIVELRQHLADGTPIKAVWALLRSVDTAKLVTVHYLENEP